MQQGSKAHPSPLRDVKVTFENGELHAAGKIKKGVEVPFSMTATVSAAPDGSMRLHATKLKAVGVPVKGLLDLLGLDVASLMKMPPGSGIRADGDDLLLDTAAMLPPPRTEGKLQKVAITRQSAHHAHDRRRARRLSVRPRCRCRRRRNYLYFYGGRVRFGKLTMSDADMQLIDADPSTPFDFFPAHYEDQLVAGYQRNTRRKGLQVFMPDYSRVRANGGMLKPPRVP